MVFDHCSVENPGTLCAESTETTPVPFNSLKKSVSGRNGTFHQWKKKDGPTTTTIYAEIKDGSVGDSYVNQKWGD